MPLKNWENGKTENRAPFYRTIFTWCQCKRLHDCDIQFVLHV